MGFGTLFFARIIGPFALVMAASMLTRRRFLREVFSQLAGLPALAYTIGVVEFLLGLVITFGHAPTGDPLSVLVSVLGAVAIFEGALFLFSSSGTIARILAPLNSDGPYYAVAAMYLTIGGYVTMMTW